MKRGEIWEVYLPPTGAAAAPRNHPGIIISADALEAIPIRIVVPITEWKGRYTIAPWMVQLQPDLQNNLNNNSCADTFQVRLIPAGRFVQRLGKISEGKLKEIDQALLEVLGIEIE